MQARDFRPGSNFVVQRGQWPGTVLSQNYLECSFAASERKGNLLKLVMVFGRIELNYDPDEIAPKV
jgi:hypothetical protein